MDELPPQMMNFALAGLVSLVGVLIGLALFFVRKLIARFETRIDKMSDALPLQQSDLKHMGEKMVDLEREVRQLGRDFKMVIELSERVAVLEFAGKMKRGRVLKGARNERE